MERLDMNNPEIPEGSIIAEDKLFMRIRPPPMPDDPFENMKKRLEWCEKNTKKVYIDDPSTYNSCLDYEIGILKMIINAAEWKD